MPDLINFRNPNGYVNQRRAVMQSAKMMVALKQLCEQLEQARADMAAVMYAVLKKTGTVSLTDGEIEAAAKSGETVVETVTDAVDPSEAGKTVPIPKIHTLSAGPLPAPDSFKAP